MNSDSNGITTRRVVSEASIGSPLMTRLRYLWWPSMWWTTCHSGPDSQRLSSGCVSVSSSAVVSFHPSLSPIPCSRPVFVTTTPVVQHLTHAYNTILKAHIDIAIIALNGRSDGLVVWSCAPVIHWPMISGQRSEICDPITRQLWSIFNRTQYDSSLPVLSLWVDHWVLVWVIREVQTKKLKPYKQSQTYSGVASQLSLRLRATSITQLYRLCFQLALCSTLSWCTVRGQQQKIHSFTQWQSVVVVRQLFLKWTKGWAMVRALTERRAYQGEHANTVVNTS